MIYLLRKPLIRRVKADTLSLLIQCLLKPRVPCASYLLPCYSLVYLGRQLLNQHCLLVHVFFSSHRSLPRFPRRVYNSCTLFCASSPSSATALVFVPAPVPVPILCSTAGLHPRSRFRPIPVSSLRSFARLDSRSRSPSVPITVHVPVPAPVRSFPSPFPSPLLLSFLSPLPSPSTSRVCPRVSTPVPAPVPFSSLRSFARFQPRSRSRVEPVLITVHAPVSVPVCPLPVSRTRLLPRYSAHMVHTPGLASWAVGCPQAPPPVCRDDDACGMKVPAVKQKRIAAEDMKTCYFPPLRQMLGLVGEYLRPVLNPSEPTSPHVDIARATRE